MMKIGCMKRLLATVSLAVGCCFARGGDFSGTWTDTDTGLTWSYEYDEEWGDGLILTGFTGECPENLTIPSSIAVEQAIGNEEVTNDYVVEALYGTCCADMANLKSVVIPPTVSFISGDAFAGCGALEEVRFIGNVPAYDSDFEFSFETTFEGTPYLEKLRAENANDLAENAKEISGASGTVRGDNMLATPNEPDFPADGTNDEETFDPLRGYAGWLVGSKWYKWTAPATTTVWFDTKGSDFNTVLGAYEISWNPDDPTQVAWIFLGENGGFSGKTSLVSFKAVQGRTYYICVGGNLENDESRARGNIVLNWRTGAAVTLTLQTPSPKKSGAYLTYKRLPVPKGKPVGVLPQPARDGYSFTGWYTKKSGGAKVTASTKFTKATTLYARWTLRKYRVTLVSGAGCASVSGQGLHPYGSTVTISAAAQPGYKFYGWEISEWVPSATAFTNYESLWRKNQTAKVKMPAGNVTYTATFVKENEDFLSLVVGDEPVGATPDTGPWYAEQTLSLAVPVTANSQTYPTVTTSKLPTGAAFKLVNNDCEYVFSVPDTSRLPPGRNVVKVMAKNRWGKTMYANLVVFGRNKTAANAWLNGINTSVLEPYKMKAGVTQSFADLNITPVSGCTITKMTGLPTGLAWNATKKQFTGYPTRPGVYTVTITATKKVGKSLTSKVS
ncbi:MAG: InlB B-repeat-containing protein, partial [Kiritimatiellae bacterium]|nr:InlB B-repeat-containing protein [Kiritimatiellia bacterium]